MQLLVLLVVDFFFYGWFCFASTYNLQNDLFTIIKEEEEEEEEEEDRFPDFLVPFTF